MNFQKDLNRIGLEEFPDVSLTNLKLLQRRHLFAIPFENLDIHVNKRIIIDYERIFEKVVLHRRGGFCYEWNGLFYHLLEH
ncbi:MAG: arylamine N-acetyltransferase [Saprospiraceae bacterium]|nr:arylamine N-acetyltransferase [Saprospiraceae bacterium]